MTTATYRQLYRPKPALPAWLRRVWGLGLTVSRHPLM